MSKAEKRACQYTGYCKNQSYSDFLNGYHQAEKDLELTWLDIQLIWNIFDEIANDDSMEDVGDMSDEEYYQEVLKRFKNMKDGSKGNDVKD